MPDFEKAFRESFQDSDEMKRNRRALLTKDGDCTPTEAIIVDEAFTSTTIEILALIGRAIDGLAPHLRPNAMLYILRGVVINMETAEDQAMQEALMVALTKGIPVVVAGGTNPDCQCESCQMARLAKRSSGTRH